MSTAVQQKLHFKRLAAGRVAEDLQLAKKVAHMLAEHRSITIEDVRAWYEKQGMKWTLGKGAGSLFSGIEWTCVGFVAAQRPESHGRMIRKWGLAS